MEFKNKNDYSVIVFSDLGYLCKFQYVHDVADCARWLDHSRNYSTWTKINVYVRRSGRFLMQYVKGRDTIPNKPR